MDLNLDRVRENVAKASTEDLLDRITVFRNGMEPAALEIVEKELRRREVTSDVIQHHWENRRSRTLVRDDVAVRCSFCERPAVSHRWGWYRFWRKIPLLPWRFACCEVHLTNTPAR